MKIKRSKQMNWRERKHSNYWGLVLTAAVMVASCSASKSNENTNLEEHRAISEVLADSTPKWMSWDGVQGTGIGKWDGEPAIYIFLKDSDSTKWVVLPDSVEGYPVVKKQIGTIRAEPDR